MKIIAISDLHGTLISDIEECDLLLIAGDICPVWNHSIKYHLHWLQKEFSNWVNHLNCQKVVMVGGNHDFGLENITYNNLYCNLLLPTNNKVKLLQHEAYKFVSNNGEKINIFGTPYCHKFYNWAYMYDDDILTNKFNKIKDKYDIILSHDAPYGISDICFDNGKHIGSVPLFNLLNRLTNCKWNIHGHLHTSNHDIEKLNNINVINVSILNEQYENVFKPYTIVI